METKTQSPVVGAGCLFLSSRLAFRLAPGPPCLLALYVFLCVPCGSRRLIGSPLASYRPAPRPIRHDGRGGTIGGGVSCHAADCGHRMAAGGWRRTDGGVCLLASDGNGRRAVIDGGWLRAAGVGVASCLPRVEGRSGSIVPRSFLDRSSFPLIVSSNRRGPGSFHHLIVSSTGRNLLSIFARPPPAGSSRLACSGLVPPSPAGGCEDLCHGLRRRAGRLLVCVLVSRAALSLLLVRSLLYDLRRSCRSFLPGASLGVLWAFLTAILSALAFLKTCP